MRIVYKSQICWKVYFLQADLYRNVEHLLCIEEKKNHTIFLNSSWEVLTAKKKSDFNGFQQHVFQNKKWFFSLHFIVSLSIILSTFYVCWPRTISHKWLYNSKSVFHMVTRHTHTQIQSHAHILYLRSTTGAIKCFKIYFVIIRCDLEMVIKMNIDIKWQRF